MEAKATRGKCTRTHIQKIRKQLSNPGPSDMNFSELKGMKLPKSSVARPRSIRTHSCSKPSASLAASRSTLSSFPPKNTAAMLSAKTPIANLKSICSSRYPDGRRTAVDPRGLLCAAQAAVIIITITNHKPTSLSGSSNLAALRSIFLNGRYINTPQR